MRNQSKNGAIRIPRQGLANLHSVERLSVKTPQMSEVGLRSNGLPQKKCSFSCLEKNVWYRVLSEFSR
jgi:hypothetical protein